MTKLTVAKTACRACRGCLPSACCGVRKKSSAGRAHTHCEGGACFVRHTHSYFLRAAATVSSRTLRPSPSGTCATLPGCDFHSAGCCPLR
jgi:hypothetical protein